ncbi:hypothetical protein GCM10009123_12090 [Kangiella japonica]|uniref:Uncharacterized protein n=1 Tax=Kangiella japonica TaxID=647384 RepID=A0ABN0SY78_9GAMM
MSNDNLTPIDMGFAEFVAKLISEVFDAVVTSQAEQQEKFNELQELMILPQDSFIDHLLQQDSFIQQVDELLAEHFPANNDDQLHAIYSGAPYQPASGNTPEFPAVFEKLGVKLSKSDYHSKSKTLTDAGVLKIYRKAATPYAVQKRNIMTKLIEQGLSNIVVDSGKINAKLTFSTNIANGDSAKENPDSQGKESNTSNASIHSLSKGKLHVATTSKLALTNKLEPIQPINRFVGILKPNINKQVRLTVKPASNKSPQDVETKANIFSEVELNFKTIR